MFTLLICNFCCNFFIRCYGARDSIKRTSGVASTDFKCHNQDHAEAAAERSFSSNIGLTMSLPI